MSLLPALCRLLAALVLLAVLPSLSAQDKPLTANGQVKVGIHKYKMEAGKLYQLKIDGDGFSPNVSLRPGYFAFTETLNQGDTFQAFILPSETREHRITILPNAYDDLDDKSFDYKLTLTPIPLAEKPLLEEKGKLAATDPAYSNAGAGGEKQPHKAFTVQLKARQVYIITLKGSNKEFDPYLYLEGPGGMIAARDDDGAGNMNARIFIQPRRGGEYKIIATAASKELGDFTLTVQTTPDKPEK